MKKLMIRVETIDGDVDYYEPDESIVKTYSSDFVLVDIVPLYKKHYSELRLCDLRFTFDFFDEV